MSVCFGLWALKMQFKEKVGISKKSWASNCWQTAGKLLANCWENIGKFWVDFFQIIVKLFQVVGNLSTNDGKLMTNCWQIIGNSLLNS